MIYRYACKPRPDHKFKGCDINLLPASLRTKEKDGYRGMLPDYPKSDSALA